MLYYVGDLARALDDALEARSLSQEEIGQLLDEILRNARDAARQRRCGEQLHALEHAMDEALAQAEQEDEEIEQIIDALVLCAYHRNDRRGTWSRAS